MRLVIRLRAQVRLALALAGVAGGAVVWALMGPASAAVVPPPPPGAPAVESAPTSMVGFNPELPLSVVAASAARGSHWRPERAIYGTDSINDIAIRGAGGTTIRVDEIYPTTRHRCLQDGVLSASAAATSRPRRRSEQVRWVIYRHIGG